MNKAWLLLLITGALIGVNFPLGKLSGAAGISPLVWSLVISLGSACVLSVAMAIRGVALPLSVRHVRYYLLAGVISYAVPNLLVFTVIPHLGSGFTSIFFTLSPILTLCLSSVLGASRPNTMGILGILLGLAGALLIVLSKGSLSAPADAGWLAVAFLIPMALASGNVYRTLDWPSGTHGLALAVGSNAASALVLAVVAATPWSMGSTAVGQFDLLMAAPKLIVAQVAASALMFSVFFRLQAVGGPVYLSQIGYVAAAVGLAAGQWVLGERYGWMTWLGAGVVAGGVVLTTRAQR